VQQAGGEGFRNLIIKLIEMTVNAKTSVIRIPLFYSSSSIAQSLHTAAAVQPAMCCMSHLIGTAHAHTAIPAYRHSKIVWVPDHEIPKAEKSTSTSHGSQETFHKLRNDF
jgi:hypothetical protein